MARKDTRRNVIRMPGGPAAGAGQNTQMRQRQSSGNSDVDGAMAALDANVQVRDRSQLPSKVRVITPAVIQGIVHSIIEQFGGEAADAEQVAQLVASQTQMQMKLQQTQDKLENYTENYKKLYEAYQQSQELMQQSQSGQADFEQYAAQYQQQIADLQQRNAQAVDAFAGAQLQADDAVEKCGTIEQELLELDQILQERDSTIEQMNGELQNTSQGATEELEGAREQITGMVGQIEELEAQNQQLEQQLGNIEAGGAEASEALNQEQSARDEAERDRDEARGQLTVMESELGGATAKVDELKTQLKASAKSGAKIEAMEIELEKFRNDEGDWLEEKRRLASQLSNETNNRRQAEEKLKAIEKGEVLPEAAKELAGKFKKSEEDAAKVKTELEAAKKDLATAKKESASAAETAKSLDDTKSKLAKAEKELADLNKTNEKGISAAKELGMLKRKFESAETDLEGLRASEGKWLEEKRRMASQLSNETNLRRELEAKYKDGKKKLLRLAELEKSKSQAANQRDIAERSLVVIEEECETLRARRDELEEEQE
ncbi:MAG: hypothetical protein L3J82_06000, partial [Planctomycetes bacterium]|nr:hypothetical protein [Planctomycetota bacterium]